MVHVFDPETAEQLLDEFEVLNGIARDYCAISKFQKLAGYLRVYCRRERRKLA